MLVLSRRENEKILFPNLGISVEVVKTKANTVRLGIEAPEDIRVIRGELANEVGALAKNGQNYKSRNPIGSFLSNGTTAAEIQKNLDVASLAIHLAQNQLRQGLSERAEKTLDQAIQCLAALEAAFYAEANSAHEDTLVRESTCRYEVDCQSSAELIPKNALASSLVEGHLGEQKLFALTS